MIVKIGNKIVLLRSKISKFLTVRLLSGIKFILRLSSNDRTLGNAIGSGMYRKDSIVEISAIASNIGNFLKWDDGNISAIRLILMDSNKSHQAIFERKYLLYYNVNLHKNGGNCTDLTSYEYGQDTLLPSDWSKAGYSFNGWKDNAILTGNSITYISAGEYGDKEFWASSNLIDYSISYLLNGGSNHLSNPKSYTIETNDIFLCAASKADYDFIKWENEQHEMISCIPHGSIGDRFLSAIFDKRHLTIDNTTLEMPDHNMVGESPSCQHICEDINPVVRYNDGKQTLILTNSRDYDVTYANNIVDWSDIGYGLTSSQLAIVFVTGNGYYDSQVSANFTISYTRNAAQVCTVTLNPCGGDLKEKEPKEPLIIERIVGQKYQPLPTPTKIGNIFEGWYTEETSGTLIDENSIVLSAEAHVLYAHWSLQTYSITYNSVPTISNENPTEYTAEDAITFASPLSIQDGYVFTSWTPSKIDTGTTGNLTVTLNYDYAIYSITYLTYGGTNPETNPTTYTLTSDTIVFDSPIKTGYTGEYDPSSIPSGSTGNQEITAVYELILYTISYELDCGNNDPRNLSSYNIESDAITLYPATKEYHEFKGWYDIDTKQFITSIPKGSVGNKSLSASFLLSGFTDIGMTMKFASTDVALMKFDLDAGKSKVGVMFKDPNKTVMPLAMAYKE